MRIIKVAISVDNPEPEEPAPIAKRSYRFIQFQGVEISQEVEKGPEIKEAFVFKTDYDDDIGMRVPKSALNDKVYNKLMGVIRSEDVGVKKLAQTPLRMRMFYFLRNPINCRVTFVGRNPIDIERV